jgi:hypothetical protein
MIGRLVAAAGAAALLALGTGAIVAPGPSAVGYGIAAQDADARALIRAMGARDLALGVILGIGAARDDRAIMRATLSASMIVAAADAALVYARRGAVGALRLHAGGIVAVALARALV